MSLKHIGNPRHSYTFMGTVSKNERRTYIPDYRGDGESGDIFVFTVDVNVPAKMKCITDGKLASYLASHLQPEACVCVKGRMPHPGEAFEGCIIVDSIEITGIQPTYSEVLDMFNKAFDTRETGRFGSAQVFSKS